jgi:SAM-dependent methyltransferase
MLTDLQYRILRTFVQDEPQFASESSCQGVQKLKMALGDDFSSLIRGKTVIDFGCAEGRESLELARHGARRVIGLDIRQNMLDLATRHAEAAGLGDRCEFSVSTNTPADVIVSFDAFEHFQDPFFVLETMHDLLSPRGVVIASFGPTWCHPFGGHLFSVFPWAHLLFSEEALIRWRKLIRDDGATRFCEVEGGLNKMTIAWFEQLVSASRLRIETLETIPIRSLRFVHCRLTREFTTSIVRAKLVSRRN